MTAMELVLGVDGGGSHTRAWIARRDSPGEEGVLGRGRGDESNPRTTSMAAATHSIEQAVQAAFDDAKIERHPVASACIGLAGADREAEKSEVRNWAERIELAKRVVITNDALPILYAASRDGVGIALISGTGSLALGRGQTGITFRSGGWGPVMGDEGSGYAIAREGLRSAARAADGRGAATQLLDRFLTHFNLDSASELIPIIYSRDFGRAEIAGLAPLVFRADGDGDSVATGIIQEAACQLAETVGSVAGKLFPSGGSFLLSLSGGVLLNQEAFRDRLCDELAGRSLTPSEVVLVPEPVVGALVLASLPS